MADKKKSNLATVRKFVERYYPAEQLEEIQQQIVDNRNTLLMLGGVFVVGLVVGVAISRKGD
jgi:hypothetical protein